MKLNLALSGVEGRTFRPEVLGGLACRLVAADAAVTGGFVTTLASRFGGILFTAATGTSCTFTAADSTLGGRPTISNIGAAIGLTFTQNLVTPGSARTVVLIGRSPTSAGSTILQMSGENTHRVALVRLNTGGYLAAGGAAGLVSGNSGAVQTTKTCTVYTVSASRAVTCDEGAGNRVTAGSPMAADDTGSTVAGGALLTQIPGLFGAQPYVLAEMLVYARVLTAAEQLTIRKYAKRAYGI